MFLISCYVSYNFFQNDTLNRLIVRGVEGEKDMNEWVSDPEGTPIYIYGVTVRFPEFYILFI